MLYKDTMIATPTGQKKLSDFQVGDLIFTLAGDSFTDVIITGKVIRIDIEHHVPLTRVRIGNTTIFCSDDHKFLIYDTGTDARGKCFYYFKEAKKGFAVVKYSPDILENVEITDVDKFSFGDMIHLHLNESHIIIAEGFYTLP